MAGCRRTAPRRQSLRPAASCLAPRPVRRGDLHDRSVVDRARSRKVGLAMSHTEAKSPSQTPRASRDIAWSPCPVARRALPAGRILPIFLTLAGVVLAVWLGHAMWNVYMVAPW